MFLLFTSRVWREKEGDVIAIRIKIVFSSQESKVRVTATCEDFFFVRK